MANHHFDIAKPVGTSIRRLIILRPVSGHYHSNALLYVQIESFEGKPTSYQAVHARAARGRASGARGARLKVRVLFSPTCAGPLQLQL